MAFIKSSNLGMGTQDFVKGDEPTYMNIPNPVKDTLIDLAYNEHIFFSFLEVLKNKEPVEDLDALRNIASPEDGEVRQILSEVPKIVLYVFNTSATTGLSANDGTTGMWNELKASGSLLTEEIDDADRTLGKGKQYLVSTTSGNITTLTLPASDKDILVDIKNVGDGIIKVLPSNSGIIDDKNEIYINGTNTSFVFETSDTDKWKIVYNYVSGVDTVTFKVKDTDGNDIPFADGTLTKDIDNVEGQVRVLLTLPTDKRVKQISSIGWYIIDRYTGEFLVEPAIADTTLELELEDVAYNYGFIGAIIAIEPNPEAGIYPLDGSTTPPDKLLAAKIKANPDNYVGFTVNDDDTIVTPDWRGDILYAGGNRDLDANFGTSVEQSIQRHNHSVNIGGGWIYSENKGSTKVPKLQASGTGHTGSTYTRVYGRTVQSWCIIGTTLLKLSDTNELAKKVTVTFNNGTVNGGLTSAIIFEGVSPYRFKVDLASNKMLDKNTMDNDRVTVVNAWSGEVLVYQVKDGGDLTVDIAVQDKPASLYIDTINPEARSGKWTMIRGNFLERGYARYEGALKNVSRDGNPPFIDCEGIGGKSFVNLNGEKILCTTSCDLNKRSFFFSFWFKGARNDNSTDNVYLIGNLDSGSSRKALHIGWKNDSTFKVGFYSADVDITLPNEFKFSNNINKWIHIAVYHDTTKKSTLLWLNEQKIATKTHSSQYESDFQLFFGRFNTGMTMGKMSQFRFAYSNPNEALDVDDTTGTNIYNNEVGHLIQYN